MPVHIFVVLSYNDNTFKLTCIRLFIIVFFRKLTFAEGEITKAQQYKIPHGKLKWWP